MITVIRKGNLFDSAAQTLVNAVNTTGVMGKGIAAEFRRRYPQMFRDYQRRCATGQVRLGEPYPWQGRGGIAQVINFPTKGHWRSRSHLGDIERGLAYLAKHLDDWEIGSLAVPPLGAGHGGLAWEEVGPLLYRALDQLPVPVELYAPHDVPVEQASAAYLHVEGSSPLAPQGEAGVPPLGGLALFEAVRRIDQAAYAWPVSRARLQPLAYFTTAAGIPTGWAFTLRADGPESREVPTTVAQLLRTGLLVERQTGAMRTLHPGPGRRAGAAEAKLALDRFGPAIERVVDLMTRLDNHTSRLAATTHHTVTVLADQLGRPPSEQEAIAARPHGNRTPGKSELPEMESAMAMAIRELTSLGWLQVSLVEDPRPQEPAASVSWPSLA